MLYVLYDLCKSKHYLLLVFGHQEKCLKCSISAIDMRKIQKAYDGRYT